MAKTTQDEERFLKNRDDLIVCEKQDKHHCGRHALRALTQRLDVFNDEYLSSVAEHLVAEEQLARNGEMVRITDYLHEGNGDYDIQVLKSALMRLFKTDLFQIQTPEFSTDPIQKLVTSNIQKAQAFLIEENYHYYCLRRFRLTQDYFVKLDSKYPVHHEFIHREKMLTFFYSLWERRANVYVAILYVSDDVGDQACEQNIEARLWPFPDSPADLEPLK